jgi:nitrilase
MNKMQTNKKPSKNQIRVACVQINSGHNVLKNLATIDQQLQQASAAKVDVVLLPENFSQMPKSANQRHSELWQADKPDDSSPVQLFLIEAARRYKLMVIGGSVPIRTKTANSKPFSRCIAIDSTGSVVAYYDKLHLFDVDTGSFKYRESDDFTAGPLTQLQTNTPSNLVRLDTDQASCVFGLTICYDLRFPEMFRRLLNVGAKVITVPAAFTFETGSKHWQILLQARAIENQCYILAAGQCGEHPNDKSTKPRRTWGHSMVIDPSGTIIASLEHQQALLIADIDLTKQQYAIDQFPAVQHQRML